MAVENTRPLTKRQGETMGQILAFFEQHGRTPTYRELRDIFGLRSVSTVHQRVQALRNKGFLRFDERHIALAAAPGEGALPVARPKLTRKRKSKPATTPAAEEGKTDAGTGNGEPEPVPGQA